MHWIRGADVQRLGSLAKSHGTGHRDLSQHGDVSERRNLRSEWSNPTSCCFYSPNIAEGQGRLTPGEFRQFLGYARGFLLELETLILVARNLNYLDYDKAVFLSTQSGEVGKILNGLLNTFYK
jgi:23S rRNA-intervening sequence protein